jgi:hypothetical protein
MHGWWFPGRQVMVVLPLAALAIAWWTAQPTLPAAGPARPIARASGPPGGKGRLAGGASGLAGGGGGPVTRAGGLAGGGSPRGGGARGMAGRFGDGGRARVLGLAVAGGIGVVAYGWLVVDGLAGRVTWAVDFFRTGDPAYRAWRLVLPDYLVVTPTTWVLHAAWLVVLAVWAAAAWRRARTSAGDDWTTPASRP